jgi:peroxiredoxin
VISAAACGLAGLPTYLALDTAGILPAEFRGHPWPLELTGLLLAAVTVWLAGQVASRNRERLKPMALAGFGVASALALPLGVSFAHRLPPPSFPVGAPAPDFVLNDQDGQPLRLSSLRGTPVLLVVFLGTWCPYCRNQLTALATEARNFHGRVPQILAVSTDPPEALAKLKTSLHLPFKLLSDPDRRATPMCGLSMHCLVAVDGAGDIRWGGFNENWRTPPPYGDLLDAVSALH